MLAEANTGNNKIALTVTTISKAKPVNSNATNQPMCTQEDPKQAIGQAITASHALKPSSSSSSTTSNKKRTQNGQIPRLDH